jgi:hypothetical protein
MIKNMLRRIGDTRFNVDQYKARKNELSALERSNELAPKRSGFLGSTTTIAAIAAVGAWLLWVLFVIGCACTLAYVVFHFISKFW